VHELDGGRQLDVPVAPIAAGRAAASVSIGRRRLPPESIRWRAISGIISALAAAMSRIIWLTRCMSASTSCIRGAIDFSRGAAGALLC
jgi:hypothetical protein